MKPPNLTGTDRFKRIQTGWRMKDAYPALPGRVCSCGCGAPLVGRQRRWASKECGEAAYQAFAIYAGYGNSIRWALEERDGGVCAECGKVCGARLQGPMPRTKRWSVLRSEGWEADHIVPVQEGGGACGLDNFQTLCLSCHKAKTAAQAKKNGRKRTA